jgi:hypothetical protein
MANTLGAATPLGTCELGTNVFWLVYEPNLTYVSITDVSYLTLRVSSVSVSVERMVSRNFPLLRHACGESIALSEQHPKISWHFSNVRHVVHRFMDEPLSTIIL